MVCQSSYVLGIKRILHQSQDPVTPYNLTCTKFKVKKHVKKQNNLNGQRDVMRVPNSATE